MILRVSPDEGCSEDKKLNKKKESSEIIRTFFLLVDLEAPAGNLSGNIIESQLPSNKQVNSRYSNSKHLLISLYISIFGCTFGCNISNTPKYEY